LSPNAAIKGASTSYVYAQILIFAASTQ